MLQIGEVHHAPAGLLGGVGPLEVLHQGEQPPHRRVHRPEILQEIRPAVLEPLPQFLHPLFAGAPDGLHLLRRVGAVHNLLAPRRREGDGQGGPGRVPPPPRPLHKGVQGRQGGGEAGGVIGVQIGVAGAQLQGPGDLVPPVGPLPPRVVQQQAAPGGLPRVVYPLQGKGPLLPVQPGGGIGVGLHPPPDVQHDLHEPAVVPPGGHGVHQPGEITPLGDVLIAPVQHIVEGAEHEDARLPLVAQAEVRIQLQQVAALPQKLGAEGVDGGDLGLIDQGGLPPQVGVGGALRQPGGQLLHDAAPQLGGGGLGVGNDQEAVDVQPLPLHPGQEPLHQYPGLAGAGGGGHQQPAAPVVHRSLLFTCQGKGHRALLSAQRGWVRFSPPTFWRGLRSRSPGCPRPPRRSGRRGSSPPCAASGSP